MTMIKYVVVFLFSSIPVFGIVPDQEIPDLVGLFDFRTFDWNHVVDTHNADVFTDSKIMYDTLHDSVLVTDFDSTKNFISYETKLQKIKIYYQFVKHLSMFKRLDASNSYQLKNVEFQPIQRRRTFQSSVRTATTENPKFPNSSLLNSKVENDLALLTQFFNAKS